MKFASLVYGLAPIAILVSMVGMNLGQEVAPDSGVRETSRVEFFAKFAHTDYDIVLPTDPDALEQRRRKNQRYDNENWVVKTPSPETDYAKRTLQLVPPPAFPIEESDTIVTGVATSASAHLSNDKTGVYTEYTIRVERIFKDGLSRNLTPDSVITIDRAGGAVRYPDGHKVAYMLAQRKLPAVGSTYALFLRDDKRSKNFQIVTIYELTTDSVIPLDAGYTFDEVKGMTKSDFLRALQERLAKRSHN